METAEELLKDQLADFMVIFAKFYLDLCGAAATSTVYFCHL